MKTHLSPACIRRIGGSVLIVPFVLASMLLSGCKGNQPGTDAAATVAVSMNPADYDPSSSTPPALKVNGDQAMQYTKDIVGFGPRPVGSAAHRKVEDYIKSKLKGLEIEEDKFTANTPVGNFPMNNIIAKIPGKKNGIIVLASHYDTNYPLRNENFVGANDGAATSGLLIELAHQLKSQPNDGYSVWFVFTDGEEAMVQWSASDSVYGSKHLAKKWVQDGTAKKVKAFLLLDMIGDKDLDILRDQNSTPWLLDVVGRAAQRLGYQSYFYKTDNAVEDDHLPFKEAGIPVADIIDLNYGWNNIFHHTTEDTLDKLSPKSLKIVGDTVLESIRALNTR